MNSFIICALICSTFVINMDCGATELQCYQCNPVTQECEDNKADVIKCGDVSTTRCSRQVKKDSPDKSKAIRKCVIPDKDGSVNCPIGFDCSTCDKNLCNANPTVISTTSSQNSSPVTANCFWTAMVAAIFVGIYL